MAGDWIAMRVDLADDEAVIGIACKLSLDVDLVVGKLHRLWAWANGQLSDGHTRVSTKWIDDRLGCAGFAQAMMDEGWLKLTQKGSLIFPNFERWNLASAKRRLQDTRRKSKTRKTEPIPSPSGQMSASQADKNVTTEQDRTEQNNNHHHQENSSNSVGGEGRQVKPEPIAPATADPFAQVYPPPLVSDRLRNYTGSVIEWAWGVSRQFVKMNPDRRNHETAARIVQRFADCISRHGKPAFEKLAGYYAVTDPMVWQAEVELGQRLPVGASPAEVCDLLFPKSVPKQQATQKLPSAEELAAKLNEENQKNSDPETRAKVKRVIEEAKKARMSQ